MRDLLPFVVTGLVTGSLYGLAATGLVLTYKTSGIFNFAHGAVGAAAAYAFYDLREVQGLPWPIALVLAVGVLAPALGLALSVMSALLEEASTVRRVVATVGVLLVIQGVIQFRFGIVPLPFSTPLPTGTVDVLGTLVGYDQMFTMVISLACLVALARMFRISRLGLEMRAVVDNSELLDLAGGSPKRVRATSWMIGSAFAALSGVLLAPTVGLDAVLLTLLVVQAFGAAAIGRFQNLTTTYIGGIVIGVAQALLRSPDVNDVVPLIDKLTGLANSVSFLVLFGILVFIRRGTFSEAAILRTPRKERQITMPVRVGLLAVAGVVLLAIPHLYPAKAPVFIQGAVFTVIFVSFYLLIEVSGQVSLCQVAFVAVGATTFAHLTTGAGLPWMIGVVVAGLVAMPVGAIVAIPATRLSGVFLALATLGFGILVQQMVYNRPIMFGTLGQRSGSRPAMFGLDSDAGYFYLCVAIAAAAIITILVVRRARLGRLLGALADSPVALVTHGSSINVTQVLVFCLSASMAAVAGALSVGIVGSVSSAGVTPAALTPLNSLLWLATLALAGRHPIASPIVAAFLLVVAPSYSTSGNMAQIQTILFGVGALTAALFGARISEVRERVNQWISDQGPSAAARATTSPVRERNGLAREVTHV